MRSLDDLVLGPLRDSLQCPKGEHAQQEVDASDRVDYGGTWISIEINRKRHSEASKTVVVAQQKYCFESKGKHLGYLQQGQVLSLVANGLLLWSKNKARDPPNVSLSLTCFLQ